jgi:hypothetical protein
MDQFFSPFSLREVLCDTLPRQIVWRGKMQLIAATRPDPAVTLRYPGVNRKRTAAKFLLQGFDQLPGF